ncbi:hypothetical protein DJ013_04595 [Arcticibacterium luteifluviistationis]|uniref:DUF2306 domain-containing protein n=1 Tax=Arcticibacterium luteifluviistationis TaxID=1784714 RepID=A0A2Z4GHJ5_9BACT|nr:hypothetical protein DJ013_04595 [Arcticibacterium luteifluviistationis]
MVKKVTWYFFIFLCIVIGLYPLLYFFVDRSFGLLASKSPDLLKDTFWNIAFYGHIIFGGLALLIGWSQFSLKLRTQHINWHKGIGKIYIISVLISGLCGIYIGFYATGGLISQTGFIGLGLVWLSTTLLGFKSIKEGNIKQHQNFMTFSYAACFAAVMLRIWLPLLTISIGDFIPAYRIVAWLCWVPNIIVAYFIVKLKK